MNQGGEGLFAAKADTHVMRMFIQIAGAFLLMAGLLVGVQVIADHRDVRELLAESRPHPVRFGMQHFTVSSQLAGIAECVLPFCFIVPGVILCWSRSRRDNTA